MDKLHRYETLLRQWQKTHNLVAPGTLGALWLRHFADSAQLLSYAKGAQIFLDLGSGAGFPGLVISICLANHPECVVHLVESSAKKCAFLLEVARQTGARVEVHNQRIADVARTGRVCGVDVITARALAPLDGLLALALPFFEEKTVGLFPKGREAAAEIEAARWRWDFDLTVHRSLTDPEGKILEITRPRRGRQAN